MQIHGNQDVTRKEGTWGEIGDGLTHADLLEPSSFESKRSTTGGNPDPLFLFACHVEWHQRRNLRAYQALLAGLDASDKRIREIVETMLHRSSPRPQREGRGVYRK
jgi:hypothetical protein